MVRVIGWGGRSHAPAQHAALHAERASSLPLAPCLSTDDGDWFVRLVAWLLWLKRNAQGPWRLYIDLLPRVSAC